MASGVKTTTDAIDEVISKLHSGLPTNEKIRAVITRKVRIPVRGEWSLFYVQPPPPTPLPLCKDCLTLASYPGGNSTLWVLTLVFITCMADAL